MEKENLIEFYRRHRAQLFRMLTDTSGKVAISSLIVEVFLVSILLPVAIVAINDTNTTGWDTTAATFWTDYLPILIVVGVVIGIVFPLIPRGKGA